MHALSQRSRDRFCFDDALRTAYRGSDPREYGRGDTILYPTDWFAYVLGDWAPKRPPRSLPSQLWFLERAELGEWEEVSRSAAAPYFDLSDTILDAAYIMEIEVGRPPMEQDDRQAKQHDFNDRLRAVHAVAQPLADRKRWRSLSPDADRAPPYEPARKKPRVPVVTYRPLPLAQDDSGDDGESASSPYYPVPDSPHEHAAAAPGSPLYSPASPHYAPRPQCDQ